nr:NAD(P)H-dependent oxidoreductase [Candidatus Sigynarchaeota archaeon]
MKRITIIYCSKGGRTRKLAEEIKQTLDKILAPGIGSELVDAAKMDVKTLKESAAFIIGSPDYFSYVAGHIKTFFDDLWDDREQLKGRPAFGFITHGGGGKAAKPLEELCGSFKFNFIKPVISVQGEANEKTKNQIRVNCEKLVKMVA